jgi:hypothetical protein
MVRTDKKMAAGGWRRRLKAVAGADGTAVATVLGVEDGPPASGLASAADAEPGDAGGASGGQVEGGCSVAPSAIVWTHRTDASVGELAAARLTEVTRLARPRQILD